MPHLLQLSPDGDAVSIRPSLRLANNDAIKSHGDKEFVIGLPTVPREKVSKF